MASQTSQYQSLPLGITEPTDYRESSKTNAGMVFYKQNAYVRPGSKLLTPFQDTVQTLVRAMSTVLWRDAGGNNYDTTNVTHQDYVELQQRATNFTPAGAHLAVTGNCVYCLSNGAALTTQLTTVTPLIQLITVPTGDGLNKRVRLRPKTYNAATGLQFAALGDTISVVILSATTYELRRNGGFVSGPHTIPVNGFVDWTNFTLQFETNTGYVIADTFTWQRTDGLGLVTAGFPNLREVSTSRPVNQWWVRYREVVYFIGPAGTLCAIIDDPTSGLVCVTVGSRNIRGSGVFFHEGHLLVLDGTEVSTTNQRIATAMSFGDTACLLISDLNQPEVFFSTLNNEADLFLFNSAFVPVHRDNIIPSGNFGFPVPRILPSFAGVFSVQEQVILDVGGTIYRGTYVGLPLVYSFEAIASSPNMVSSVVNTPLGIYGISPTGFTRFNGLTFELYLEARQFIDNLAQLGGVRELLQTATGNNLYCAGFDRNLQSLVWQYFTVNTVYVFWFCIPTKDLTMFEPVLGPTAQQHYLIGLPFERNQRYFFLNTVGVGTGPTVLWRTVNIEGLTAKKLFLQFHAVRSAQNIAVVRELLNAFVGGINLSSITYTIDLISSPEIITINIPGSYETTTTQTVVAGSSLDIITKGILNFRSSGRYFGFTLTVTNVPTNTTYVITDFEVTMSKFDADK